MSQQPSDKTPPQATQASSEQQPSALPGSNLHSEDRLHSELDQALRQVARLEALHALSLEVVVQHEPDQVIARALELAVRLLDAEASGYWQVLKQGYLLRAVHGASDVPLGTRLPAGSGLTGQVVASGQSILVEDYRHFAGRIAQFSDIWRSLMLAPVKRGETILGVLVISNNTRPGAFNGADLAILERLASVCAVSLENAQLLEVSRQSELESRRRAEVSGAINTLSFELTAALEPKAMLERILERATALIGGDLGGVFLHHHLPELEVVTRFGDGWITQPRFGLGATGRAVETGQSVLVEDYPNWEHRTPAPGLRWLSAISAPLRRADTVLGAITLADTRRTGQYSSLDLFALERFAALASIALENARLHNTERRVANEERLRNRISSAVASLRSVKEFSMALLEELSMIFGYRFLSLYTLETSVNSNASTRSLQMQAQIGYRTPFKEISLEFGINGRVARTGQAVLTSASDPDFKMADDGMTSIVCVPLRTGAQVLGTLCIESKGEPQLQNDDLELITSLVESVSFALENARLYKLEQQRARDEHIRSSVSNALVRLRNVEELCRAVVNEVASSLAYTHVCMLQLESSQNGSTPSERLRVQAQVGYRNLPEFLPLQGSFSGQIARTQQAALITDSFEPSEYLRFDPELIYAVGVPLLGRDGVLGTLVVESAGTPKLTTTDLEMLVTLAAPISVALENATLHESLERRAKELENLGREAHFAATHDTLTGLPNRRAFEVDAEQLLQQHASQQHASQQHSKQQPFCLAVIDLVGFKAVNDNFGHAAGDEALKMIAQTLRILSSHQSKTASLQSSSGDDVFAYRVGGDEFFLLIENDRTNAFALVQQVISTVQGLEFGAGSELQVSPNIGLAEYPTDATDLDNLLTLADTRMYAAKRAGKPVLEPDEFEHPPVPRRRKEDAGH